jgi:hypothetical protein
VVLCRRLWIDAIVLAAETPLAVAEMVRSEALQGRAGIPVARAQVPGFKPCAIWSKPLKHVTRMKAELRGAGVQVGCARPVHGPCPAQPDFRPVVHGRCAALLFFLSPLQAGFPLHFRSSCLHFGTPLKVVLAHLLRVTEPAVNGRPEPDFVGTKPPEGGSQGLFSASPIARHEAPNSWPGV